MGEVVLPEEVTRGLELMDVCVACVRPQQVSVLVRVLTARIENPQLSHLKRVHTRPVPPADDGASTDHTVKGKLLVVLLWAGRPEDHEQLPADTQAALASFELQLQLLRAPRHAPLTR